MNRKTMTGFCSEMIVAVFTVHISNGFFMSWSCQAVEYHIIYLAIALALVVKGGGSFSIDFLIAKKSCLPGQN